MCEKCLNSKSVKRYRIILTGKIMSRFLIMYLFLIKHLIIRIHPLLCQKILESHLYFASKISK